MALNLGGVIPPVTTPFTEDELDLAALKTNLERLGQTGLSGFLILGSNGENVMLTDKESEEVLAAAAEAIAQGKLFMAGTGRESTKATSDFTRRAAQLGAQCALVVTPSYFKGAMDDDALETHFIAVAESSPIPILLYNVPKFTGLNMAPPLVARLAQHPNIAGIKDSSGNIAQLTDIIARCPEDFAVFVGAAPVFYPALCMGAVGGILAVANCAPEYCVDIYDAFRAGDHQTCVRMQRTMNPLANLVTTVHGVAGLKVAMGLAGYVGGTVRSPLSMPQSPAVQDALRAEFARLKQ